MFTENHWLMTDVREPSSLWVMLFLGRRLWGEYVRKNKPVSSIPWECRALYIPRQKLDLLVTPLSDGWWPGIKLRKSSPLQVFSGQCFVNPTERRTRTHVCCSIYSYISDELGFQHSWAGVSMLTKVILFWSPCFVCLLRSVFPGCRVQALQPFTSLKGIILLSSALIG